MKRIMALWLVLGVFLLMGQTPVPYVTKSADLTADALVATGEGWFFGATVITNGTNAEECTVYDNTSAAGNTLVPTVAIPTSATDRSWSIGFNPPLRYGKGIYVDCGATGTTTVYYHPMILR